MFGLLLLALALAMDAFAAALCQGAVAGSKRGTLLRVAGSFGAAQGLMPLLGWTLGTLFAKVIQAVDHWVALLLLAALGARMIREGIGRSEAECAPILTGWALAGAAVATSIDAAAAGVTLPLLNQPLWLACGVIALITALLSAAGVAIGRVAGARLGKTAELFGGVVLIVLGLKIFVQHQYLGA